MFLPHLLHGGLMRLLCRAKLLGMLLLQLLYLVAVALAELVHALLVVASQGLLQLVQLLNMTRPQLLDPAIVGRVQVADGLAMLVCGLVELFLHLLPHSRLLRLQLSNACLQGPGVLLRAVLEAPKLVLMPVSLKVQLLSMCGNLGSQLFLEGGKLLLVALGVRAEIALQALAQPLQLVTTLCHLFLVLGLLLLRRSPELRQLLLQGLFSPQAVFETLLRLLQLASDVYQFGLQPLQLRGLILQSLSRICLLINQSLLHLLASLIVLVT
mmetsp:Transcript_129542/g.362649  ORF Transcript_129542/g.362649 Transcript_129542/m.362649 type:complete len:269 (-) Transcript_129542:741-1547(-)